MDPAAIDAAFNWKREEKSPLIQEVEACDHFYLLLHKTSTEHGSFAKVYCARCLDTKTIKV